MSFRSDITANLFRLEETLFAMRSYRVAQAIVVISVGIILACHIWLALLSRSGYLTLSQDDDKDPSESYSQRNSVRTGAEFQHSFNSTCNRGADKRGPRQKVISYAIFGDFSRQVVLNYLKPSFTQTIRTIPYHFPGWTVRIYHNLTTDEVGTEAWKILVNMLQFAHVDLCNATVVIGKHQLGDSFAMTWRWLPLLDEMVDTVMSRDSDSRIIPREVDAVNEWLASNKTFHIMRDHPGQCLYGFYPIMGGMWGVKVDQDRQRISRAFERIFKLNHEHRYDYDQYLLLEYIWPIAKTNMMAHDSYCCLKFPPSQPFPTRRSHDGLFVGERELPEEVLKDPCPLECRPASTNATYSDWDFC